MKHHITLYYLLFVLLIMGSFASMAQNDYGITILGLVSFAFAFLFVSQMVRSITGAKRWYVWNLLEAISLSLLALLLGFRVFYIHFAFVEVIFGVSGVLLAVVYARKLITVYKEIQSENQWLTWLIVLFYMSAMVYTISMITVPFTPSLAEPAGVFAFVFLIVFAVGGLIKRNLILNGEKISVFTFVSRLRDRSVVVLTLYLLFTFYMGLTKIDFLPKLYSDEFPKSYFQLVDQSDRGKGKLVDGKYKHQVFKEMYDRFMQRNPSN